MGTATCDVSILAILRAVEAGVSTAASSSKLILADSILAPRQLLGNVTVRDFSCPELFFARPSGIQTPSPIYIGTRYKELYDSRKLQLISAACSP
jgi:hypothetical protein